MEKKKCLLYDNKMCDNCGECNMCDLDPKKVCDSCGACLDMDDDYNTLDIDLVMEETDDPELLSFEEMFPDEAFGGDRSGWYDEDDDDESDDDYTDEYDVDGNFYYDEDYDNDEYDDEENDDDLKRDFGDFFGRNRN